MRRQRVHGNDITISPNTETSPAANKNGPDPEQQQPELQPPVLLLHEPTMLRLRRLRIHHLRGLHKRRAPETSAMRQQTEDYVGRLQETKEHG